MASKLQQYSQLADRTAQQITGSYQMWTAFLETAARLYKYPYHEQLMIFAQRPEATACADYELWNKQMHRYVRRGSQGIALIDTTGDQPRLKYVFDVSDTGGGENSRRPYLWQYQQEHREVVAAALERRFAVSGENGLAEQLERVSAQLVDEFWNDHQRDILGIVDNSFMEEYDDFNIGVAFRNAAVVSITYMLLSRCGMEPGDYFAHEDFLNVFDFNTPQTVAALGTAISQSSEQVLRQIEVTIKNYERQKLAERSESHERTDLHAQRGLSDSRFEPDRTGADAPGQIRQDAEEVPARASSGAVEQPAAVREAVPAPAGDRRDGEPASGADDARADAVGGRDREPESQRPDEVGGTDEHAESTGGGNHPERTGVQLNLFDASSGEQLSVFPTEAEQIAYIEEAERVTPTPFAFSFAQEDIDHVLRLGSNTENSRMVMVSEFQKQKPIEVIAARLSKEYHGGAGFKTDHGEFSVWYAEDGIHLARGRSARYEKSAQVVSWEAAAERIGQLMEQGKFASNVEVIEAESYERTKLAEALWYHYGDISDEARAQGYMPTLSEHRHGGFPDATARLSKELKDPAFRQTLVDELSTFSAAYAQDNRLMRFRIYNPRRVLNMLQDYGLPRRVYNSEIADVPRLGMFITEDEIDATLNRGSHVEGGKGHIYGYLTGNHTTKEKVDFLKKENGISGSSNAVSGTGWFDSNGKGIKLRKPNCADVELNWNKVLSRLENSIRSGRYFTPEEKALYDEMQTRELQFKQNYNTYNDIKHDHPDDIVLFQVGDFFEMYGEDAKAASELLDLHLTTRPLAGAGRVEMCGIPAHKLEQYVEQLRDKYDVTIAATQENSRERCTYTLRSIDHEAEVSINAHEAEYGADGTRAFSGNEPMPTVRELYEQYKPMVSAAVIADEAYRNACRNSDRENAYLEGAAAVQRAVLASGDMQLLRLYSDITEFHNRLHREVLDETYPRLQSQPRSMSQEDIDDALRAWNGSAESKRAVVWYMEQHGREKDTAAWLSREYGGDPDSPLHLTRAGTDADVVMPWPKVQRRIAQLIKEDRFFTEEEQKRFEDIDPIAIREALEQRGIVDGQVVDPEKLDRDPFIRQVTADVERIAQEEQSHVAVLSGQQVPPYKVGDTVYLDNTAFEITAIRQFDVELRDPALTYPIFRAENKARFDIMLHQDPRNSGITEYLAQDLNNSDSDLQEVLTWDGGLLTQQDKDQVAGWFRAGESNSRIAQRLADAYAGRADTMMLQTGEGTDYFATAAGLEINIDDKYTTKHSFSWLEISRILRAMYQQERDGFSHEPMLPETPAPEREPVTGTPAYTEETVAFYSGEKNNLPYDVEIRTLRTLEPEHDPPEPPLPDEPGSSPVSIPINGEWQTFPNVAAAEQATYADFKADSQRNARNYHITDDALGVGGPKAKYQANINAIRLLKYLEAEGLQASPEQQEVLSRYVGWGGLTDAFDESKQNWAAEFRELRVVLTPEEYTAARASTLNAHYTSPTVIKAIYEAVGNMGFQTGNILEPSMGVGNFFGLLPDTMAGSKLYGVELDSITGRIAKQLYPQANITVAGFETTDRRDFFDLAVGNVPFGQYQVNDRAYNKLGFSIHDYFFAKTLDQVRPGGVIAFVTSRYTMDKQSLEVRKYIAQRAELLGAIRLPNNAFRANAGTEVVSDILFLQKRDRPIEVEPDWVHLGKNEDGFSINSYFIDHPEMILGRQSSESTQYGRQDFTVEPIEGLELADQLHDAVKYIRGSYQAAELPDLGEEEAVSETIPADPDVKNYSYTVVDGEVYFRENSVMVKPDLNATARERVKGMVELRDCVQRLIAQQMDSFESDMTICKTQQELNVLYDAYTAKYGLINSRGNALAFSDDSSYYLLCSLEVLNEDGELERKADIFTKRTIKPHEVVTSVDTASEALALSIAEKARVDLPYMAQLTGLPEEKLAEDL